MSAYKETKCKICGEQLENPYQLLKHRKERHPESVRTQAKAVKVLSPYERIQAAEKEIAAALLDIDAEQARLQERQLALDNLRNKYKHIKS